MVDELAARVEMDAYAEGHAGKQEECES